MSKKYSIDWKRLRNPSLWTRFWGRVRNMIFGRTPYLRPPMWSDEHSAQTIRKITEYEREVREKIMGDRAWAASVAIYLAGFVVAFVIYKCWVGLLWYVL